MNTEKAKRAEHDLPAGSQEQTRKPYRTPKLVVHGTLQEITRNVGSGFVDFPNGSSIAG